MTNPARPPNDPCAAHRELLEALAPIAERAKAAHEETAAHRRRLRREYDDALARTEAAMHASDRRRALEEKDQAQRLFREARLAARDAAAVEEAAARWLATINQINLRTVEAQRTVAVERRRTTRLVAEIEAAAARTDAARITRESAEQRAQQAREALAACEELHGPRHDLRPEAAESAASPALVSAAPGPLNVAAAGPASGPTAAGHAREPEDEGLAQGRVQTSTVLARIVEGDDVLLGHVAALLAGDASDAPHWRLELETLRGAIRSAAIEATAIDLPDDALFWSEFSALEAREVIVALSSLGYRYDGSHGFAEGRIPTGRDLALAVGYAGLDPRRVRRWPSATEIPLLLESARVAVAEFLEAGAPNLTLGEMVSLLDRRATQLTSLWDAWGRVRPLLLQEIT